MRQIGKSYSMVHLDPRRSARGQGERGESRDSVAHDLECSQKIRSLGRLHGDLRDRVVRDQHYQAICAMYGTLLNLCWTHMLKRD